MTSHSDYNKKEKKKRWVFNFDFKISNDLESLTSNGNTFQSLGAARVRKRPVTKCHFRFEAKLVQSCSTIGTALLICQTYRSECIWINHTRKNETTFFSHKGTSRGMALTIFRYTFAQSPRYLKVYCRKIGQRTDLST